MSKMSDSLQQLYGNRLRVRACGICIENDQLLLVNHHGLAERNFWAPPGGGIQFGETASDCVTREFYEETGLFIEISDFLFAGEFIKGNFHSVELFFLVKKVGGVLITGTDPESANKQIIKQVEFMDWEKIGKIDKNQLHGIFKEVKKPSKIVDLRGYFKL